MLFYDLGRMELKNWIVSSYLSFVTASKQVSSMSSLARQVQLSFCWEGERWQKLPTMAADESRKKRFF